MAAPPMCRTMGSPDTDVARPNAAELRALYGAEGMRRRATAPPVEEDVEQPALSREFVWALRILLVLTCSVFAMNLILPRYNRAPAGTPTVLYGQQASNGNVCTELEVGASGTWSCAVWDVNLHSLPVVQPPSYVGRCTHLRVDQLAGRWTCSDGNA
jgi:hypothetical protein